MDVVGRRPASDGDYQMVEDVERLCQLRRIKLDILANGMGKFQAEALLAWFVDRPVGIGKCFVAKAMCFPSIQAIDRAICAVDCKPAQAEKGCFPDKRTGELTRICEAMEQADSSVIEFIAASCG
jgi:hypothetical protein